MSCNNRESLESAAGADATEGLVRQLRSVGKEWNSPQILRWLLTLGPSIGPFGALFCPVKQRWPFSPLKVAMVLAKRPAERHSLTAACTFAHMDAWMSGPELRFRQSLLGATPEGIANRPEASERR